MVAPGVVRVGQYFYTICIIDSNNVTLQILLKIEGVKGVCGVGSGSVLHPDGGAGFVIQVDQQVTTPSLADNLGSVEGVDMVSPVDGLVGANTVGVVDEFNGRARLGHLLQLPTGRYRLAALISGANFRAIHCSGQ